MIHHLVSCVLVLLVTQPMVSTFVICGRAQHMPSDDDAPREFQVAASLPKWISTILVDVHCVVTLERIANNLFLFMLRS
jgi:hypothetical protein